MKRYVIIGGDAAGMSAAMQIVRHDADAHITVLETGEYYSYAQCGLPYVIEGSITDSEKLIARSVETFREKYGIDAKVYHEARGIDPKEQVVYVHDKKESATFTVSYDVLLIATGAAPDLPLIPGTGLGGVHTLKTIPDLEDLQDDLRTAKRAAIIGAGYIGLEAAEAFRAQNIETRLLQRSGQVANIFDIEMARLLHDEARAQGTKLHFNEEVMEITSNDHGNAETVVTKKGRYPTDVVLFATGIKPNTTFLHNTGIDCDEFGAIKINPYMETNLKNIYAAGDCAMQYHRIKQKLDYLPLGTHANKQGRIAGMNMVGKRRKYQGVVGTSIFRFHRLTAAHTGLSEKEGQGLGYPIGTVYYEGNHIAGYFQGRKKLHVKLIYNKENKRLLGGQIIGEEGVDKRIDVLATALYHEMTYDELEDLDLAYAPPYNGVWDPLQQAARRIRPSE